MSVNIVKNKPNIYGLTGGIASGKSTAANFFITNNIKVFDSDAAVKQIWQDDASLKRIILNNYKIDMSSKTGKQKLSILLFNDSKIKKEIEDLVHPKVINMIDKWISENMEEDILIIDMPLLFEINYQEHVFKTILVYVDHTKQLGRLMIRDNISYNDALNKISNQMDLKKKKELANYIVDNNSDLLSLYNELAKLLEVMKGESQ